MSQADQQGPFIHWYGELGLEHNPWPLHAVAQKPFLHLVMPEGVDRELSGSNDLPIPASVDGAEPTEALTYA